MERHSLKGGRTMTEKNLLPDRCHDLQKKGHDQTTAPSQRCKAGSGHFWSVRLVSRFEASELPVG